MLRCVPAQQSMARAHGGRPGAKRSERCNEVHAPPARRAPQEPAALAPLAAALRISDNSSRYDDIDEDYLTHVERARRCGGRRRRCADGWARLACDR